MAKYLDETGLSTLWDQIKTYFATKSEISSIPKFEIAVVESLPTTDISNTTVYLVANTSTQTNNLYTEYIYVDSKWEKLGEQTVDLSGYATTEDLNQKQNSLTAAQLNAVNSGITSTKVSTYDGYATSIGNKVDKISGKGLSTNDYTTTEKNKLAGIAEGANNYSHPTYTSKTSGLYKITVDGTGHVSGTAPVTASDIPSHTHSEYQEKLISGFGIDITDNVISAEVKRTEFPARWVDMPEVTALGVSGEEIWKDYNGILYFSKNSKQYVIDPEDNTWKEKDWGDLKPGTGALIWKDYNGILKYDYNKEHIQLNPTTNLWETYTSNIQVFSSGYIWDDGTNIYYSQGTTQYKLNKSTNDWEAITWNISSFQGYNVWKAYGEIYLVVNTSSPTLYYKLNKTDRTWETKTWEGTYPQVYNEGSVTSDFWEDLDGTVRYNYPQGNGDDTCFLLNRDTLTWTAYSWRQSNRPYQAQIEYGRYVWYDYDNTLCKSNGSYFSKYVLGSYKYQTNHDDYLQTELQPGTGLSLKNNTLSLSNSIISQIESSKNIDLSKYLLLSGGTMTGPITLNAASGSAAGDKTSLSFTCNSEEKGRIGSSSGGIGAYSSGTIYIRPNQDLDNTNNKGLVITDTSFTYNGTNVSLQGHTHSYLPLSGGTMTGTLTLKKDKYIESGGGINCNNADIIGCNSIYTGDLADNTSEGIRFYRDSTHWDSLTAAGGVLYFKPNDLQAGVAFTDSSVKKIEFQGHTHSYLPLTGGTLTGALNGTTASFNLIYANRAGSGVAGGSGISYWRDTDSKTYGTFLTNDDAAPKHGWITGDYRMATTISGDARGWVWYKNVNGVLEAKASLAADTGNLALNGEIALGCSGTSSRPAVIRYNSTDKAIEFLF